MRREEWGLRKKKKWRNGGGMRRVRRVQRRWLREGDVEFFNERNSNRSVKDKKWISVTILG